MQDFTDVLVDSRELGALLCSLNLDLNLLLSSLPLHNIHFCQYSSICRIKELWGLEKQLGILQGERYYLYPGTIILLRYKTIIGIHFNKPTATWERKTCTYLKGKKTQVCP